MPDKLEDNVCRIVDHEWQDTGSGNPRRPRCGRCKMDYIDWIASQLNANVRKIVDRVIGDRDDKDLPDTI